MAKISSIIGNSYFEQIRDRIAVILALEIENQLLLSGNYDIDADVWLERNIPFDKVEVPAVNVSLASGNYDNKTMGSVRGSYDFFIDCYCSAKATSVAEADRRATLKLHRLLAICRSILENPVYKTLDFVPPGIQHTSVSSLNIRSAQNTDALNTVMGRLLFKVVATETTSLLTAPEINQFYTSVKIDTSDQGYVYYGKKMGSFNSSFNTSYSRTQ